jgi:hypothetical protein
MLQQSPRCGFNQIQHFLKSVGPAVIRIGHFRLIRVGREFEEQANAIARSGWGALLQGIEVLPIHCEYQVEAAEVLRVNDPCTKCRHVVTTAKRSLARACIRGSADVVRGGSSGVDFECEIRRFTRRDRAKHGFRGGRPANVTEADE